MAAAKKGRGRKPAAKKVAAKRAATSKSATVKARGGVPRRSDVHVRYSRRGR